MTGRHIGITILIILLIGCLSSCVPDKVHRVLVIHSYEESYAGYPDFNKCIRKEFEKNGIFVDMRVCYLDCESYAEDAEKQRMSFLLDSLGGWKPEVILVNDDQATYSLLSCGHPLVKEVPVIFGGVNYPNWKLIAQYPNVTGFEDKIEIMPNIEMAKELFGDKIGIFTILDSTYLDRKVRSDICEQVKGRKVTGFMHSDMPYSERLELVDKGYTYFKDLKIRGNDVDNSGVLWALSKFYREMCYIQLKRDFTTINIGGACSSPSLTAINEAFGYGEKLLGGYMTTMPTQVEEQVKAAVRILHGEKVSDIPIVRSKKEYVVDWDVVSQLHLSKDRISDKYLKLNIPFSEKYPVLWMILLVLIVLAFVGMSVCIIVFWWREHERKRLAFYTLGAEKEKLALAIEGGDTFAWKYDNGYFDFEDGFWESLGMPSCKPDFETFIEFVHPDHRESVRKDWEEFVYTKRKIVQRLCDFNGNGYQWWEFRYNTVSQPLGGHKTAGLVLNVQSVKDREKELEEARRLAEKAELKESFMANMSHEIRTPLNAIVGFSNLLASDEEIPKADKDEYISTINKNNELLLKLVNDILELSRIESGYMSFVYEKCEVNGLIDDIYATHRMLIPESLKFLKEVDDSVSLEINVDRSRLIQVLTNFINNACKFTSQGSIKLGFQYLPETMQVRIYVEDTGRGIPDEEQKMIFSRFYKQDEFAQGTGLGLSICKVIIEKLGGIIELTSEVDKGSCFSVLLPCEVIS